jgi:hypothetical protein
MSAPVVPPRPRRSWSKRRNAITAVLAVWGLLLAGLAMWSAWHDQPTVGDQSPLSRAVPVARTAVGELVVAAGPSAVPVVSADQVQPGCRITPLRRGTTFSTGVRFYTPDGPGLLSRLAARLPTSYGAVASTTALRADAGDFVSVRGRGTTPGLVQLTVATGCRPADLAFTAASSPLSGEPPRVLAALGVATVAPGAVATAPCPSGGAVTTAQAVGRGAPPAALGAALGAGATVVFESPSTLAFRRGPYAYALTVTGDEIRAAVTSGC